MSLIFALFLHFIAFSSSASATPQAQLSPAARATSEARLTLKAPGKTITFLRSSLLARQDLVDIEVEDDPTAKTAKKVPYRAIPVRKLFEEAGVALTNLKELTIQYHCLDGFSGPISAERLLSNEPGKAQAYLAIEPPDHPWPVIRPGTERPTAGPFYLVWRNAKASQIGSEEWPFQLTGFKVKPSLRLSYPQIFPKTQFSENHPVSRGFKIFTKNCFSCHTLNLQGGSKLGPDLNHPMSPTEYFAPEALKTQIRNPQALHSWPQSKMKGFSQKEISDSELEDLVSYLKQMAKERPATVN